MNTKVLVGVLVIALLAGAAFVFYSHARTSVVTQNEAIQAVIALHPELASYQTTTLPPSAIEAKQAPDGWYLGFIQRGSGVPGILTAQCYHVSNSGEVALTGQYTRDDAVAESVALDTCKQESVTTPSTVLPYGRVVLKLGELATFKNTSIRPLSMEEDSRCPVDAQCIWAGQVRVKIEVVSAGTSASVITLGQAFATEGAVITLTEVLPAKHVDVQLSSGDYRLSFTVVAQNAPVKNSNGTCYVSGCSSQLCTDAPDAVSTCEYTASYACYKSATCERQTSGECGWTMTSQLSVCLANS